MSHFLPTIETAATAVFSPVAALGKMAFDKLSDQPSPQVTAPQTAQPTQPAASTTAIQSQLAKEQNARSTATVLTSPGGLHDEPTTTTSLLMGT